ncbi:PREDICTED: uncharacterized protein LOC107064044 [Polistes dominula]|uniref:Uncharacterized protein LOC107064044 n=1 Tax=Polistes dominula TaxID=743375 RepID=A0ABM1HUZ3_POLDO|nr:PREDICTED: uncharacterized protein LOC107064044 [Polistes dominula]
MHNFLCIRPYKQEDTPYCKELAEKSVMSSLNSIYSNLMMTSLRYQILFTFFVSKLYWPNISFPYCLIYPLIIAFAIYITLHVLAWELVQDFQKDLFDVTRNYNENGDKCFWVAVAYNYRPLNCFRPYLHYTWLTETELEKYNINLSDHDKKIVGFIGVNKNVRSNNSASVNGFLVHNDYARKGIGTQLIKTALQFCDKKKYTRLNLQLFDLLTDAEILCKKLGFEYYDTQSISFFPIFRKIKIYEYSCLTDFAKSTLHINYSGIH